MADPIDHSRLVADARVFLGALKANNTRRWFGENKARYDRLLKRPAERLMADISAELTEQVGHPVRSKLFRPHRDVRHSDDKSPYHTHLHMMWSLPDGRAWFFGVSPEYTTVGAGIMTFGNAQLPLWREAVAGTPGVALAALLAAADWRIDPPTLKHVPAPFPADHVREALLRRIGLVAWQDSLSPDPAQDTYAAVSAALSELQALMDWLAQICDDAPLGPGHEGPQ